MNFRHLAATSALLLGSLSSVLSAEAKPAAPPEGKSAAPTQPTEPKKKMETATFAGGCFWCIEAALERLEGVDTVESGYTNGKTKDPTYEQVCSGLTGHTEAVKIAFDPAVISYEKLLKVFLDLIDPTQVNAQGPDHGTQYRTGIYFHDDSQKATAEKLKQELAASGKYSKPIATEIQAAATWYAAEDYHQDYHEKHFEAGTGNYGYLCHVSAPKLEKLKKMGVALKAKK
jgi:peptide-methionine (S)-S-oxide reductase